MSTTPSPVLPGEQIAGGVIPAGPAVRFFSLWSINGPLDVPRLCAQLRQFKEAGLDGVVFHPWFYPNAPVYLSRGYMERVSQVVLRAKALGLRFWLYDEDGWPSSTVGGELLKQHPGLARHWAGLCDVRPDNCLAEFDHDARRWYLADHIGAGVDFLNPELAPRFVELTHERYRTGLSPEAFEHVEGFFCDEPELGLGHDCDNPLPDGAIPWTPELPRLYAARFGEELAPRLPLLFFPGPGYREMRIRFWEFLCDVFCEAFLQPINPWRRTDGKLFTAHIKGEEHPLCLSPLAGSRHRVFKKLALPGVDARECFPANDFYPRQGASAAPQFGDGRCTAEAFVGAGWGASPEDLERYLLWLGGHGVTDFALHLSQYQLGTRAIRGWSSSQPLHLNWVDAYPEVLRRVRERLSSCLPAGADTLVIAPYRGIAAEYEPRDLLKTNMHNGATYPATKAGVTNRAFLEQIQALRARGVNYHLTDERTFEKEARLEAGRLHLGRGAYGKVIVAPGAVLSVDAQRLATQPGFQVIEAKTNSRPTKLASVTVRAKPETELQWRLVRPPRNSLVLEPTSIGTGRHGCVFESESMPVCGVEARVVFADAVHDVALNGRRLALVNDNRGWTTASLNGVQLQGSNLLEFSMVTELQRPCTWVEGVFRVFSRSTFRVGLAHMLLTDGPFVLRPSGDELSSGCVQTGYPFLRFPLVTTISVTLPPDAAGLSLGSVHADAARVWLDDEDLGWIWGPEWSLRFPRNVAARRHVLRVHLIPSTYNFFGPHHHLGGDHPVMSPEQCAGNRNFVYPVDLPLLTTDGVWRFRPFSLPQSLRFF